MSGSNASPAAGGLLGERGRRQRIVYCFTVPSIAIFVRGQLAYMVAAGWDVTVGCSPGRGIDAIREREGVVVVETPTPREISPKADLKSVVRWVALLRRVRPDVLNVSTPKGGLIGALAGWLVRVPKRVYIVRGLRYESEHGLRRRLLIFAERVTIACSTDVVAVSHSVREELASAGLLRRKDAAVIGHGSSNGVDVTAIQERVNALERQAVREGFGVSDYDAFVIAFVGRLRRDKGVYELVSKMAATGLQNARLLTVGDVEDAELIAELDDLGDRWISRDWLDDIAPVLLACDVVCLSTHREGFHNVVLEAAAAGRPAGGDHHSHRCEGQRGRRSHRSAGARRGSRCARRGAHDARWRSRPPRPTRHPGVGPRPTRLRPVRHLAGARIDLPTAGGHTHGNSHVTPGRPSGRTRRRSPGSSRQRATSGTLGSCTTGGMAA